ncbi:MAG: type 2 isopentenyl-diphosphate Delta-isomerase [Dehalococcoidia bacterium]|nr:type 2 isopentenyl-diphosphate Delta-isomerase [Dehalococcoidia bacterium]
MSLKRDGMTGFARQANSRRKEEQMRINLEEDVQFHQVTTGFENYRFLHQALPELSLADIDLSATLFGKQMKAPLIVSSMVGGVEVAGRTNRRLAEAAQTAGIAMGLGSQRAAIDDSEVASTYQVRHVAPDIPLFANIGAVQLNYGYGVDECRRAVDMIEADALILHLNPLQEALQPEGNTDFSGLLARIEQVCRELPVPVIVKEVGWGISEQVARRLSDVGVSGIEVGGAGGTSWGEVERLRSAGGLALSVATFLRSWGIPTADSIRMARRGAPQLTLIASGGIRTGLDVAKAIALGAEAAGLASPLFRAANTSSESVLGILTEIIDTLRVAMFCLGSASLGELRYSPLLERIPRG